MNNTSLFDLLPEEEAKQYKPLKSTDWKWTFKDYPKEKNGIKVFSCFACGGGSTMGYKLAGCDVVGCCEIDLDSMDMNFNYEPVTYGEIKHGKLRPISETSKFYNIAKAANDKDKSIADTRMRLGEKGSAFQTYYIRDDMIMPTQRAKPDIIDLSEIAYVSKETIISAQTFPQDYNFINDSYANIGYVCGMSVPPIMIKRIVTRLIESGIFKDKLIDKGGGEE